MRGGPGDLQVIKDSGSHLSAPSHLVFDFHLQGHLVLQNGSRGSSYHNYIPGNRKEEAEEPQGRALEFSEPLDLVPCCRHRTYSPSCAVSSRSLGIHGLDSRRARLLSARV